MKPADVVIRRLAAMQYDVSDPSTREFAERLLSDEWTQDEVVKFLKCTEECNPTLEEDIALRRMSEIRCSVETRLRRPLRKV